MEYTVDGRGLRQSRTAAGSADDFVWSTIGGLPVLLDDGNHAYLYGPSLMPVAQVDDAGAVEYLHGDLLGSVRSITDATGAVVGSSTFDAFGSRAAHTGASDSAFGFTGNWTDADTGLLHLRARDYDPATGQFLTVDPAVDTTRQPYAYTGNNPLTRTDPSGLDPCLGYNDWGCQSKETIGYIPQPSADAMAEAAALDCMIAELERKQYEEAADWQRALIDIMGWGRAHQGALSIFAVLGGGVAASAMNGRISPRAMAGTAVRPTPAQMASGGNKPTASALASYAEGQGWIRTKNETGPIIYYDGNGIRRLTLKAGSSRTPGSETPHVAFRNENNEIVDVYGNPATRNSLENHTQIDWDLD